MVEKKIFPWAVGCRTCDGYVLAYDYHQFKTPRCCECNNLSNYHANWVRIQIYSIMNSDITFDISVPKETLDNVKQMIPIAGHKWYCDPDYYHAGWAEPLMDMLEKAGIPYILYDEGDVDPDNTDAYVAFT